MLGTPTARVSATFAAFLAFLLLAPGAARAADDECGALNSGNSYIETCPDAAYASGIVYWDEANAVTLTVPGTATTTTVTTAASNMLDVGIAVRTGMSTSAARNIALTVGGTGPVAIVQGSTTEEAGSAASRGIYVGQHSGNGATTHVTVESGVTIGAQTAPMNGNGIHVEIATQGAGAVTVDNAADIHARRHGVAVGGGISAPALANVTVTNSGDITASLNGIGVWASGAIMVTNEGVIAAEQVGLGVITSGNVTVINSGGITAVADGIGAASVDGAVSVTHSAGTVSSTTHAGIRATNAADYPDNANDVTVAVGSTATTGAAVTSQGQSGPAVGARQSGPAVELLQRGTGDAVATVFAGAALTSKHHAGIHANIDQAANDDGRIEITQGGTIAGRAGVLARVSRVSAADETRTETRPAIDVTWTGTFSHGTTATVAGTDDARFLADSVADAVALAQEAEAEKAMRDGTGHLRYGAPAGIEARVMSWREVMTEVDTGDDPGAIADNAAQMALLAETGAGSRRADILAAFRAALGHREVEVAETAFAAVKTGAESLSDLTDADIVAYLRTDGEITRTLLRDLLAQGFTDGEKAVLRAVATNDGLDAALTAAGFTDDAADDEDYWSRVKALLDRSNLADIRVRVNGGSIVATRGDGVRAYYATPNDRNGAISVSVAAGTTVSGGMAGIYVANAGMTGEGAMRIRKQTVTVDGMVTGGSDAAVHLAGGGRLTVNEGGKVVAGSSGVAVLVNDPGRSEIVIDGEVRGGSSTTPPIVTAGGGRIHLRKGRIVLAEGATRFFQPSASKIFIVNVDGPVNPVTAAQAIEERLIGDDADNPVVGAEITFCAANDIGCMGMTDTAGVNADGTIRYSDLQEPGPVMRCDLTEDRRCGLYEALPSALLAMNGLPSWAERMTAARGGAGGWAQVDAASGKWKATRASQGAANVAYDRSRAAMRAGVDMALGEDGRIGLSAHGVTGSVKMARNGGKVAVTGVGVGVNASLLGAGFHVDGQLAMTRYDVDLTSSLGDKLKDGASGSGVAAALEAGRALAVGDDLRLTPRAGLSWSQVSLRGFTDKHDTQVSMRNAGGVEARLGVAVESAPADAARFFGTLDAARAFSKETQARASGAALSATAPDTTLRLGLGVARDWDGHALRATVAYETAGGGTSEYGGTLSFTARF